MEFDELLEHLADLADLARNDGYDTFAALLASAHAVAYHKRAMFGKRAATSVAADVPVLPAPIDPRD
jgi:hypothetical protein